MTGHICTYDGWRVKNGQEEHARVGRPQPNDPLPEPLG